MSEEPTAVESFIRADTPEELAKQIQERLDEAVREGNENKRLYYKMMLECGVPLYRILKEEFKRKGEPDNPEDCEDRCDKLGHFMPALVQFQVAQMCGVLFSEMEPYSIKPAAGRACMEYVESLRRIADMAHEITADDPDNPYKLKMKNTGAIETQRVPEGKTVH